MRLKTIKVRGLRILCRDMELLVERLEQQFDRFAAPGTGVDEEVAVHKLFLALAEVKQIAEARIRDLR